MQNPLKERIVKIAFFPHLSEMAASARKGLMGRCRTRSPLSLNNDQQVLAGETDASFLLFWVGSIKKSSTTIQRTTAEATAFVLTL